MEYVVPELILYQAPPKPRLVFMRCCYENHLSEEFCDTRLSSRRHLPHSTNSWENVTLVTKPLFFISLHENETGDGKAEYVSINFSEYPSQL